MKLIYLLPIGSVDSDIIKYLSDTLLGYLHCSTKILGEIPSPGHTYDPKRQQYSASRIIKEIRLLDFPNVEKVLGITNIDLYSKNLSFVFGKAEAPGRNALFSLARLDPKFYNKPPSKELIKTRAVKEAIHELGHNYSLSHCPDAHCVMHYAQTIEDVDKKGDMFCPRCQKLYEMYNS